MPEHNQTIIAEGYESSSLLALAYGSLQQLNWTIKYAGENMLVAYTPRSWKRYDNEITVETTDNQLTVSSKMIHGEAFDLAKRTKKDVNEFAAAFEICKQKATVAEIELWKQDIQDLTTNTIKMAEEEVKEAVEIDKVMNLSKGGLQVTYGLIAINVVLFVVLIFFHPNHGMY
jgi:hypothetical protein